MAARRKTMEIFGKEYTIPPRGLYAGTPGKGPAEMECRQCKNIVRIELSKTYRKCGLMRKYWTGGSATDILATAPACEKFERA